MERNGYNICRAMLVMYIACMLLRTSVGTSNKNDTEHTKTTVSTDVLLQIATLSDDLSSWTVIELRSWLQQLGLDNFIPVDSIALRA